MSDIICVTGNPGIASLATCVDIKPTEIERIADLAVVQGVDFTVASSPEAIHAGLVDEFKVRRLKIFGPEKQQALPGFSRYAAKELMHKHNIPTARYAAFTNERLARAYIHSLKPPLVLKSDIPAYKPGLTVADSHEEADQIIRQMFSGRQAKKDEPVIVEEKLPGQQISLQLISDGARCVSMLPVVTYTRLLDSDQGPVTEGMGAYAPLSLDEVMDRIVEDLTDPILEALNSEYGAYQGAINLRIAIDSESNPLLMDIDTTFGDLETQVLLPLLEEDLFEILWAVCEGDLAHYLASGFNFSSDSCVALVFTVNGYPGSEVVGDRIEGAGDLELDRAVTIERKVIDNARPLSVTARPFVFHEGTDFETTDHPEKPVKVRTSAGRVLSLCATAGNLLDAKVATYELAKRIRFEGMHFRQDIGYH